MLRCEKCKTVNIINTGTCIECGIEHIKKENIVESAISSFLRLEPAADIYHATSDDPKKVKKLPIKTIYRYINAVILISVLALVVICILMLHERNADPMQILYDNSIGAREWLSESFANKRR